MASTTIFSTDDIVEVRPADVEQLKALAEESPCGKSRLCLHHSTDHPLHEMVNACCGDAYIRPHRHPEGKTESYHVIDGTMTVYFFDDAGDVVRHIRMGVRDSGLTFLYRLAARRWHMTVPDAPMIVYHETFRGPFEKAADVEFAPWSPPEDDADGIASFLQRIKRI